MIYSPGAHLGILAMPSYHISKGILEVLRILEDRPIVRIWLPKDNGDNDKRYRLYNLDSHGMFILLLVL